MDSIQIKTDKSVMMDINKLKPHPKNLEIYGKESVADLVENIKKYGLYDALRITDKNLVISGHRRLRACIELGMIEVPVVIEHYDNPEDEVDALVNLNLARVKTNEQLGREAKALIDVEQIKAKRRKEVGISQSHLRADRPQGVAEEKGRVRDIVAQKLDFTSGRQVERTIEAVKKIDDLESDGKSDLADIVRGQLNNKSIKAGAEATKVIDRLEVIEGGKVKSQNPSDKSGAIDVDDLKSGKRTVASLFVKPKEVATQVCIDCHETFPLDEFEKDEKRCKKCLKIFLASITKGNEEWKAQEPVKANLFETVYLNISGATKQINSILTDLNMADMNVADHKQFQRTIDDTELLFKKALEFKNRLYERIGEVANDGGAIESDKSGT